MAKYTIHQAKTQFSNLLKKVEEGEEVLIANRDRTVAMGLLEFISQASARLGVQILPVSVRHVDALARIPWHHKDPFDRLLAAQARTEALAI